MIPLNDSFEIIECADEAAWLKERDNGIGASEVAVLLGLSQWSSPFHLWAQKTGRISKGESDAEYLEYGRFMEAPAAARYTYRTGRKLIDLGRYTILRSKKWPFIFATLDRIVAPLEDRYDIGAQLYPKQSFMRGPGCCEIKNPVIYGYHKWEEGVPLEYQSQLQTQLAVSGYEWGSFAAQMHNGKFGVVDVERQPDFIDLLVEKCAAFWECVKTDSWPPVDGSDWTAQAIKSMNPRDSGASVALPPESEEWAAQLESAKAAIKAAEAIEKEAKNKLTLAIGDASFGVLPNGEKFSYKCQSRNEHVVAASTFRVLRKASGK